MNSSRQTPAIAPRPLAIDNNASSLPDDPKAPNARILRKREADRKCQRMIRERTKSRIAYLEAMVEDFRNKDPTGQVEALMRQLADTRQERDGLAKKVKNIEAVLMDGQPLAYGSDLMKEDSPETTVQRYSDVSVDGAIPGADLQTLLGPEKTESLRGILDGGMLADVPFHHPESSTSEEAALLYNRSRVLDSTIDTVGVPGAIKTLEQPSQVPRRTYTRSTQPCECSASASASAVVASKPAFNIWLYANEVLSSRFRWPKNLQKLEDKFKDDVPVRVILEGWEAVERRGTLHPSWQVLKRIDQAIFWRCSSRERLAVLYTMHILFESHLKPTSNYTTDLPEYFSKGPFDAGSHSYAINYFTWPGIRQRFFENQHRYCTNNFWTIFTRNLRVLWQYEFRDCYTKNVDTGLYMISPLFKNQISDLRTWTMGPEIFQHWPEFRSDMPCIDSIPGKVSNGSTSCTIMPSVSSDVSPKCGNRTMIEHNIMEEHEDEQNYIPTNSSFGDFDIQQVAPATYAQTFSALTWPQSMVLQTYNNLDYANMASAPLEGYLPPFG